MSKNSNKQVSLFLTDSFLRFPSIRLFFHSARIAPKKPKPLKPWEKPEIKQQSRSREPTEGASLSATVNYTSDKLIIYHTGIPTSIHTDNPSPEPRASAEEPNCDTIRTEYHLKSGRKLTLSTFKQFRGSKPADISPAPDASSEALWTPFKSHADFKFAEIALQAALNQKQVDKLLKIFERCTSGKDTLNLKNNKEIHKIWSDASALISTVCRHSISLCSFADVLQFTRHELMGKNKQYEMMFDFWCRPLWDWVLDLVCNSLLAPYFEWDAQKLYKFDGEVFIQFFDELWTVKRFWEVQVRIFSSRNFLCLTNVPEHPSCRCKTYQDNPLCRQNQALVIWHSNGLSNCCSACKSSC